MQKEIVLLPEELYYIGGMLDAKYIDYAYIAAIQGIETSYDLFGKEIEAKLVSKGILEEDFSGNLEMSEETKNLLRPIFWGEIETSVSVCDLECDQTINIHKFHFYNGNVTMVKNLDGQLSVKLVDQDEIKKIIESIVGTNWSEEAEIIDVIPADEISRFISAKSYEIGKKSIVKTFVELKGKMYQETQNGASSVTREELLTNVYEIVKGV